MDFVLRIFFSGLIAFVPSKDGKEVTVLLVNTPHEYVLAGGTTLPHHTPMLLARAASCEGCTTDDAPGIAQFLFAKKTAEEAQSILDTALLGGGAWRLSGSELSIHGPQQPLAICTGVRGKNENGTLHTVPATAAEREDFSWVADIGDLFPGTGGFKSSLTLDEPPPACQIAARLRLRSGKVFTYSLVRIGTKARPVHFRKPSGEGAEASYAQAAANWVAAEIRVPGDVVEIVDENFGDRTRRRSMKLHPQEGVVELAVLNLPPFEAPAPDAPPPSPAPGQHFQAYYDLLKSPPPQAERLVPQQSVAPLESEPQTEWIVLHPKKTLWSDLLEDLGMAPRGKGPYDLALCPIVRD